MRLLIQRVTEARVKVDGECISEIGRGYLVFLGVGHTDTEAEVQAITQKIINLRLFEDAEGKTNLCLKDVAGEVLLVSQFTLYGDIKRGRRPGFSEAGNPAEAERLYLLAADMLRQQGVTVGTGQFGAHMDVELCNDGPFTIWYDTDK